MNVEIRISDDDIERIARRIIELQAAAEGPRTTRWLTAQGAAEHLSTTEHAIRGMVKRRQIPFLPNRDRADPLRRGRARRLGAIWLLRRGRRGPTMTSSDNKCPRDAGTSGGAAPGR
jgi:hypothetical protein